MAVTSALSTLASASAAAPSGVVAGVLLEGVGVQVRSWPARAIRRLGGFSAGMPTTPSLTLATRRARGFGPA